ncbi:MAG: MlaE family lipid ABC transporter permease subunit [Desulfobacterales bacterium]
MSKPDTSASCEYSISEEKIGEWVISFDGMMNAATSAPLLKTLETDLKDKTLTTITVNLDHVSYFDDFGALVLFELKHMIPGNNGNFSIVDSENRAKEILYQVNFDEHDKCAPAKKKRSVNMLIRLGDSTISEIANIRMLVSFLGSLVLGLLTVVIHPKRLRFDDTITHIEKIGVDALPIVALISFLLGLIIAFMSSIQLSQFGANIYVASLVALAMVSELGPIMTAIVVAGRSGSAIAAEIGTMKISEEIDALYTMGFDATLFLAVPRVIAAVIVLPLLTLFSDLFAIAGGLVVGVFMLDLTVSSYIGQTLETLTLGELAWGLEKSVVFAVLIAWIGCLRGFQARGGAAAVGNAATSAVVSSIFTIILFDSIFAVIRSYW